MRPEDNWSLRVHRQQKALRGLELTCAHVCALEETLHVIIINYKLSVILLLRNVRASSYF